MGGWGGGGEGLGRVGKKGVWAAGVMLWTLSDEIKLASSASALSSKTP